MTSSKKLYIDIGGTHLRSEIHGGASVHRETRSSRSSDLVGYIDDTLQVYSDIDFVGISYAGQVDGGVIISAPNIKVSLGPIKDYFESRYGVRLEIDNDLNCAAMAEAAALNSNNVAVLYIGTGTGGALIANGELLRGANNQACEIGHIPHAKAPFRCGCGKDNCLELFASGSALEKWMEYHAIQGKPSFELLGKSPEGREIKARFEEAFVHAAATLVTLGNPEILVVGGGVVAHNPHLLPLLTRQLPQYAFAASLNGLQIVQSQLREPGITGAKLLE
jgi:glucokinase